MYQTCCIERSSFFLFSSFSCCYAYIFLYPFHCDLLFNFMLFSSTCGYVYMYIWENWEVLRSIFYQKKIKKKVFLSQSSGRINFLFKFNFLRKFYDVVMPWFIMVHPRLPLSLIILLCVFVRKWGRKLLRMECAFMCNICVHTDALFFSYIPLEYSHKVS